MPDIMTTLCQDTAMLAFGHNDYTTDNAWFVRDRRTRQLEFGVFDWQQSCVNNVGQEWAWNLHFLEPEVSSRTQCSNSGFMWLQSSSTARRGLQFDHLTHGSGMPCFPAPTPTHSFWTVTRRSLSLLS